MSIKNFTKNELISIIANMHEAVQDWENGWGFNDEEGKRIVDFGREASQIANDENLWDVPQYPSINNQVDEK